MKNHFFCKILHNLSFRNKLALICLNIGLIPVIFLGAFSFFQLRDHLIEKERNSVHENILQESQYLDGRLASYLDSINLVVWNDAVRSALSQTYDNNFDMYLTYRDVIDPLINTIKSTNRSITSITIYSNGQLNPHGHILRPLEELYSKDWCQSSDFNTVPAFHLSKNHETLFLFCQIYYQYSPYTHVVCLEINADELLSPIVSLYKDSFGVLLNDDSKQTAFFAYNNLDTDKYSILNSKHLDSSRLKTFGKANIWESHTLSSVPWTFYLYRPIDATSALAFQNTYFVFLLVLINVVIILIVSFLFSKVVVRPLNALAANMKSIENDNLTIMVTADSTDEIGQLITSFTHMVHRLQHLINEVLKSRLAQQEYEFKALQAQINPHFLYNSLSIINSKAILSGQEDISKMAQLLSTFYRTTLNKGNSHTTIRGELNNITAYITIQQLMHANMFDAIYDIPDALLDIKVPNLILQPLVENAILHGLLHKTTGGKGALTIEAHLEQEDVYIKIMDNGCGIPAEKLEKIVSSKSNSYGVQNVHHRIQLCYGDSYGLTYHSTLQIGTYVIVHLNRNL